MPDLHWAENACERRCGRIDPHPEHDWSTPQIGRRQRVTYWCSGQVIVSYAERRWADARDAEDAADDQRRITEREQLGEWVREGWAS